MDALRWAIELCVNDHLAQAQALVCEVHLSQIDFSIFKLMEQQPHGS